MADYTLGDDRPTEPDDLALDLLLDEAQADLLDAITTEQSREHMGNGERPTAALPVAEPNAGDVRGSLDDVLELLARIRVRLLRVARAAPERAAVYRDHADRVQALRSSLIDRDVQRQEVVHALMRIEEVISKEMRCSAVDPKILDHLWVLVKRARGAVVRLFDSSGESAACSKR